MSPENIPIPHNQQQWLDENWTLTLNDWPEPIDCNQIKQHLIGVDSKESFAHDIVSGIQASVRSNDKTMPFIDYLNNIWKRAFDKEYLELCYNFKTLFYFFQKAFDILEDGQQSRALNDLLTELDI